MRFHFAGYTAFGCFRTTTGRAGSRQENGQIVAVAASLDHPQLHKRHDAMTCTPQRTCTDSGVFSALDLAYWQAASLIRHTAPY